MNTKKRKTELENCIVGYIEVEKVGKKVFIMGEAIDLTEIKEKKIRIKPKLFDFLKKKEDRLFKVYREKISIEDRLRKSIKESLNGSFVHAVETMQVKENQKLAFITAKAINIIIAGSTTTLFVKSEFKGEEKDINYTNNIEIYRELTYLPIEMKAAFKKHLPEVYENIKTIQEFPNVEMEKLFLTKEEDALMNMLKRKWKAISSKEIAVLDEIQQKITAYKELNQ